MTGNRTYHRIVPFAPSEISPRRFCERFIVHSDCYSRITLAHTPVQDTAHHSGMSSELMMALVDSNSSRRDSCAVNAEFGSPKITYAQEDNYFAPLEPPPDPEQACAPSGLCQSGSNDVVPHKNSTSECRHRKTRSQQRAARRRHCFDSDTRQQPHRARAAFKPGPSHGQSFRYHSYEAYIPLEPENQRCERCLRPFHARDPTTHSRETVMRFLAAYEDFRMNEETMDRGLQTRRRYRDSRSYRHRPSVPPAAASLDQFFHGI